MTTGTLVTQPPTLRAWQQLLLFLLCIPVCHSSWNPVQDEFDEANAAAWKAYNEAQRERAQERTRSMTASPGRFADTSPAQDTSAPPAYDIGRESGALAVALANNENTESNIASLVGWQYTCDGKGQGMDPVSDKTCTYTAALGPALMTTVFQQPGPLGLKVTTCPATGAVAIESLTSDTQSDDHPMLRPGMQISSVGGNTCRGLEYSQVLAMMRDSSRPLAIEFTGLCPRNTKNFRVAMVGGAPMMAVRLEPEVINIEIADPGKLSDLGFKGQSTTQYDQPKIMISRIEPGSPASHYVELAKYADNITGWLSSDLYLVSIGGKSIAASPIPFSFGQRFGFPAVHDALAVRPLTLGFSTVRPNLNDWEESPVIRSGWNPNAGNPYCAPWGGQGGCGENQDGMDMHNADLKGEIVTGKHWAAFEVVHRQASTGSFIFIGLCPDEEAFELASTYHYWGLHGRSGKFVTSDTGVDIAGEQGFDWVGMPTVDWDNSDLDPSGYAFPQGAVIGMEFDAGATSLRVWRDGELLGTARSSGVGRRLKGGGVRWCASAYLPGEAVRLRPWGGPQSNAGFPVALGA